MNTRHSSGFWLPVPLAMGPGGHCFCGNRAPVASINALPFTPPTTSPRCRIASFRDQPGCSLLEGAWPTFRGALERQVELPVDTAQPKILTGEGGTVALLQHVQRSGDGEQVLGYLDGEGLVAGHLLRWRLSWLAVNALRTLLVHISFLNWRCLRLV